MEDWAEIRCPHRTEGVPIRAIARRMGISRSPVRSALASGGPPTHERPAKGAALDEFEQRILALLAGSQTCRRR